MVLHKTGSATILEPFSDSTS